MALSISKLSELLSSKGFIPCKYFVMDDLIFYIEVFSVKTCEIFLLYIPSKYSFVAKSGNDVYKMKYLDLTNSESTVDEYAGSPDNQDVYGTVNIQLSPDKENIEEHLQNNYRRSIALKDISKEDTNIIKALYRQLNRLKYCVQNLDYKLAILYKNYLCSIRRDDSIDCFVLKHYPISPEKKLLIVTDLEVFYDKNEKLILDINTIRENIYQVLENNQSTHTNVMNKMIENRKDIIEIPQHAYIKKQQYDVLISQLEKMLSEMLEVENGVLEKMQNLSRDNPESNLQSDITKAHEAARVKKELDGVNLLKEDIIKNLLLARQKKEDAILSIDKIMFDNTVMFNCMIQNFAKLKEFC